MSDDFNAPGARTEVSTATGHTIILQMTYGIAGKRGILVLIGAAGLSLLAVLGLFIVLGVSRYNKSRSSNVHRFMSTNVAAYFVSLLLCDVISSVGSLMNIQWVLAGNVHLGSFCTAQGAARNAGNVGTAMWTLVIAVHTFFLLVLKWRSRDYVLYTTLFVVWSFVGLVVIIGPSAVQNLADKGPYFGVSGFWCWITDNYATQRLTLEYLWMFLSALISFILYSVVLLSLRGNIINRGGTIKFRSRPSTPTWEAQTGQNSLDTQAMSLAKHMLVYPIAYTVIVLPVAVCRILAWSGHAVPFEATISADAVFMLSGFVNVALFLTIRKIVSVREELPKFSRSNSFASDEGSNMLSLASRVSPFRLPEKTSSPPSSQGSPVPVNFSVPGMRDAGASKLPLLERPVSRPANVDPTYPQEAAADRPNPFAKPTRKSRRSSQRKTGSGLAMPKPAMLSQHASVASSAVRGRELTYYRASWGNDSSSRYSAASYYSNSPDMSAVPRYPSQNQLLPSRRGENRSPS